MTIPLDQARSLSSTFNDALKTIAMHKRRMPRPHPKVDHGAVVALRALAEEPLRVSALAEATYSDISTVSRQVSAITAAGLATKVSDPNDGRAYLVALTPEGVEFVDSLHERRAEWMRNILSDWTEEEAVDFDRLLTKFTASLLSYERAHLHENPSTPRNHT